MFKDFKQFVPSKFCLTCDGCCRFREALSPWRPKIAQEEKTAAKDRLFGKTLFPAASVDKRGFFTTIPFESCHICYFFNPAHHACGIYHQRPAECQIYPFVLMNHPKGKGLALHLSCRYLEGISNNPALLDYKAYARKFFEGPEAAEFLKKNPRLFGDYPGFADELEFLFPLIQTH